MKTKIAIFFLLCLVSCSKEKEIDSIFITNKNEYWEYKNYHLKIHGIFFQFHKDGSYDKYLASNEGFDLFNNDGDVVSGPRTWSIKKDSIFIWNDDESKIEKITPEEIILSYKQFRTKGKKCIMKFSKWINTNQGPKPVEELNNKK